MDATRANLELCSLFEILRLLVRFGRNLNEKRSCIVRDIRREERRNEGSDVVGALLQTLHRANGANRIRSLVHVEEAAPTVPRIGSIH